MGAVLGAFQLVEMHSDKVGKYYVLNELFVDKKTKPRQFLVPELVEVKQ